MPMQKTLLTFVDDLYEDLELLISSRAPLDLPVFAKAMAEFLKRT